MKNFYLLLEVQFVLLTCIFSLQAQTSIESHVVVVGDTTVLNIDNYVSGDIQWQEKDSLFGVWDNILGATDLSLSVPSSAVSSEKYFRAILFNAPNGETLLTNAIHLRLKNSPNDVLVGDSYAGGHVFLNQDSFIYIVGDSVFQAPWGCFGTEINGADGQLIGDGFQNTLDILQQCQEDSIAAWICHNMVSNGFDDWYLPSIEELEAALNMLQSFDLYPPITFLVYWMSSTEVTSDVIRIISTTSTTLNVSTNGKDYCCKNRFKPIRRQNYNQKISSLFNLSFKNLSETEHIFISFPDSNNSTVQVLFDGLTSPNDQIEWDFQGGEVLDSDSLNTYLIGFDFGGYRTVKLTQITQGGDTLVYESEPFRPRLFRKQPIELPRFYRGTLSTADFDNDGFVDFLLSGGDTTQLYRNLNGENFEPTPSPIPNLNYSFSDFGDFNNDGFTDLLIGGYDKADSTYLTKLFQNMSGTGWEEQDLELPGLVHGFCEWTDYNRDGYVDFIVSGERMDSTAYSGLFKGNGDGTFEEVQTIIENVGKSAGAFGDFNNDNFPDLLISGSRDSIRYARLYKNENGTFIETPVNILPINNGSAIWADYNNDGWLDFSVSGNKAEIVMNPTSSGNGNDYNNALATSFKHYLNLGFNSFDVFNNTGFGSSFVKSAQGAADMDSDGKPDIIIAGQSNVQTAIGGTGGSASAIPDYILQQSKIVFYKCFSTDSTLSFGDRAAAIPSRLTGPSNSWTTMDNLFQFRALALFDFNQDGRIDLLRGGATTEYPSALYTNTIYRNNTAPTAPDNLQSEIISCDSIYLHWEHSTDNLTPDVALVYDLYIGTSPGAGDVLSIANNDQLQNNWFRLNRQLEKGTYYWSVRARDGARIFSGWATEAIFTIGVPTPTITFDGTQLTSDANEGNQWYNESGQIANAIEPNFTPTEDGFYFCIVADSNGCVSDSSNVVEVVLTGVSEKDFQSIRIFPNPTSSSFSIQDIMGIEEVQIYSTSGQLILSQPHPKKGEVSVKSLAEGVYFVRIITKENIYVGELLKY